jgi:hypothetical protein
MPKKGSSKATGGGSDADGALAMVDPTPIYFTFSRIRPQFSCGRLVNDTLTELLEGRLKPSELPSIAVLTDGKHMYSLNNRRLYVFKELRKAGLVTEVPVRLRPVPQTKRMATKYTPEKCALVATLKGLRKPGEERDASGSDSDSEGAEADKPKKKAGKAAPVTASPTAPPNDSKKSKREETAAVATEAGHAGTLESAPPESDGPAPPPPLSRKQRRKLAAKAEPSAAPEDVNDEA